MRPKDVNQTEGGALFKVYQNILRQLGHKRFYPEIQRIERMVQDNSAAENQPPNNRIVLKALFNIALRAIERIYQRTFWLVQWFLLFNLEGKNSRSFEKFARILPPNDRFWADPHIIRKDNKYYVFVEEYFYRTQKARLSVVELDDSGSYQPASPVLEKDYNLSYPFVFKHEDRYYLVPETSENNTIDLYESVEFPYKWQFVMHLMSNVIAVDTTLFYDLHRWWLFTAMPEKSEALPKVKLFLFYSDTLFTEGWKAHPQNPIVSDVSKARPAGKIFSYDGKIFRPSQDGSNTYGRRININEITLLSEDEYKEKSVESITPYWDKRLGGTHTFSHTDQLTVIDVYRKIPRTLFKMH